MRPKWNSLSGLCVLIAATGLAGLPGGAALGQVPATQEMPEAKVTIFQGKSKVIKVPWQVERVSVTAPEVADVQVLTKDQVLVLGKSVGSTDLIIWSKTEEMWQARVDVVADVGKLRTELGRLFPDCKLDLTESGQAVVLTGTLARAEQAVQLRKYMEISGVKLVDMTRLAGAQQVQIKIRLAEVSRTAIRALGLNAFESGSRFFWGQTLGSSGGGPINPVSIGVQQGVAADVRRVPFVFTSDAGVSQSVTVFGGFPKIGLELFIQALSENQYLRILAEPSLVALSGEEASFLAGGEYPVPVVQGASAGATSISIEYREFGVRLRFKPTVLGDGTIRLFVAPEVSQLSDVGAVEVAGSRVPSLLTRKAQTTLEMKSGQTFGMAGLINRVNSARSSRVPGLGDIPVLGALFRSVRYQQDETELVVLATVSLVEPMSLTGMPMVPGQLHTPPNDWELYAEGRVEGKAVARVSPSESAWLKEKGLHRLRGPGAWATYEGGYARSTSTSRPPETNPAPPQAATAPGTK